MTEPKRNSSRRKPWNGKPRDNNGFSSKFQGAANQNKPAKYTGFKPRSEKQKLQADLIDANDVTFSIGPAGTGKTHVAMAKAVEALKAGAVNKILLARPALESGEKLGFQPGDQNAKMAPYMRPLYDELDKVFGPGAYADMLTKGILEIVPIGFMRGRTFENAFIIVDEAQNCEFDHLKMAITRLGPGSKMVITGDPEQIDLKPKNLSGLKPIMEQLDGVEGVAIQAYSIEDVVRHPTVQRIVERLEGKTQPKQPVKGPDAPQP
ncbi:MAG: PhoH family protein [Alphaproteobacteria bacterium]|nr:PhoH family protein [Alphaproteobacteria bacterium]